VPAAAAAAGAGAGKINNLLIVGVVAAGLLLAGGYWFMTKRKLTDRQETVVSRQAEAQKLEAIIKDVENYQKRKDSLQKRIDLINQLKQNQKGPVRIMDRISQDLPDLVWLDRMSVNSGRISIAGRGLNPNAVANFVENVKNDTYFEEPQLGSLTAMGTVPPVYSFDMEFGFSYTPKTAGQAAGAAGTSAGAAGTDTTGTTKTK
jgi:Tfp pilus assembly protein PilN